MFYTVFMQIVGLRQNCTQLEIPKYCMLIVRRVNLTVEGGERVDWFLAESAGALAAADSVRFINVSQLTVQATTELSHLACTPEVQFSLCAMNKEH
jgi:hypothetical protein